MTPSDAIINLGLLVVRVPGCRPVQAFARECVAEVVDGWALASRARPFRSRRWAPSGPGTGTARKAGRAGCRLVRGGWLGWSRSVRRRGHPRPASARSDWHEQTLRSARREGMKLRGRSGAFAPMQETTRTRPISTGISCLACHGRATCGGNQRSIHGHLSSQSSCCAASAGRAGEDHADWVRHRR